MIKISYSGYRFPPEIIQHAIWLYIRFTLSFRDVEDLLAERGIMVSYETVRRWVNHFGPMVAADLRKRRPKPHTTWHLDEVYLKIDGRMVYLWRAVDAEGEVLDVLVQAKRNKRAALKLMRKLLKKYGFVPDKLVTDELRSYAAAAGHLGIAKRHERGQCRNTRAENSHQPTRRRERKMQGFKGPGSAQKFLSTHAAAYNTFNFQLSTSNAISPPKNRTELSGLRRCRRGATSSMRREPNMPADLLRVLFGNVTVPLVPRIRRCATVSRNIRALACVATRLSSPKTRHRPRQRSRGSLRKTSVFQRRTVGRVLTLTIRGWLAFPMPASKPNDALRRGARATPTC